MLLKRDTLEAIVRGQVTHVFRRWKRPTVRSGGRLRTAAGVLAIEAVEPVSLSAITEADALSAGETSRAALMAKLREREGDVFRIRLRFAGADERIALREKPVRIAAERQELEARLARMDKAGADGPWTEAALKLIADHPGRRAPDLAAELGLETRSFKARIRRLKELGLTESLEVGYRLSPRGRSLLGGSKPRRRKA